MKGGTGVRDCYSSSLASTNKSGRGLTPTSPSAEAPPHQVSAEPTIFLRVSVNRSHTACFSSMKFLVGFPPTIKAKTQVGHGTISNDESSTVTLISKPAN